MYLKQTWANGASGGTPLNATRLQYIEDGLQAAAAQADNGVTLATAAYSATNPPPYPVTSVAGRGGAVVLTAADIGGGTFPNAGFAFQGSLTLSSAADGAVHYSGGVSGSTTWIYADIAGTQKFRVERSGNVRATTLELHGGGDVFGATTFSIDTNGTAWFVDNTIFTTNTKGVFFTNTSGNQPYITGNGTNLLFRGGSTGLAIRNNADTVTILAIDNTGALTVGGALGSGKEVLVGGGAANHNIELGRMDGVSSTPFIDFHSGASATDYDVRFIVNGGNGTIGRAAITVNSGQFIINSNPVSGSAAIIQGNPTNRGAELMLHDTATANQDKFIRVNGGTLQVINNAYSAVIFSIDDGGNVVMNGGLTLNPVTSTTAPTGGAAGALPSNPVGYMSITIGGTVRKIPYYS